MITNIEKIDVFWDLDLARIWGRFWEGLGRLKTSIFALLGKFLGRLGRREGKGKKRRKKEREEREGRLNSQSLLFGATCNRGDLGRLVGVLGHFLSTLDRFGLDLKRILSSFWEVWASKMTSWAPVFFLLIPSHECS